MFDKIKYYCKSLYSVYKFAHCPICGKETKLSFYKSQSSFDDLNCSHSVPYFYNQKTDVGHSFTYRIFDDAAFGHRAYYKWFHLMNDREVVFEIQVMSTYAYISAVSLNKGGGDARSIELPEYFINKFMSPEEVIKYYEKIIELSPFW